jgi:hypothetical protein
MLTAGDNQNDRVLAHAGGKVCDDDYHRALAPERCQVREVQIEDARKNPGPTFGTQGLKKRARAGGASNA